MCTGIIVVHLNLISKMYCYFRFDEGMISNVQ